MTKQPKLKLRKNEVLILRTCNDDGTSHGGFQWPKSGKVEPKEWRDNHDCGHGLHGLLWGCGSASYLNLDSKCWIVFAAKASDVRHSKGDLMDKCKARSGRVVYCGDKDGAIDLIAAHAPSEANFIFRTSTSGDGGTSTSGYGGTSTSGTRGTSTSGDGGTSTSGYGGTSTSGTRGTSTSGYGGTSTSGTRGTSTSGTRGTSTSGTRGTSTSGDGGTSTSGYGGTSTSGTRGTSTSGTRGTSTSGDGGTSTSGTRGTSTSGDGGTSTSGTRGTSTSGDGGTSTSGYGGTSTSGSHGVAAAFFCGEKVKCEKFGCIILGYWDGTRYRQVVGYEGENGIKAGVFYTLNAAHQFVEWKG